MILRNVSSMPHFLRVNEVDTVVMPDGVVSLPEEKGQALLRDAPADWAEEQPLVPPPPP